EIIGGEMNLTNTIMAIAKGEMVEAWPYVPRIDLWHNANQRAGTLPPQHQGRSISEICLAEGWGAHHLVPSFLRHGQQPHRALGLYNLPEQPFRVDFSPDIQIEAIVDGDFTTTTYHSPKGLVSTKTMYSEEMKASGASITWVAEHVLKTAADYETVAYIFEHLSVTPNYGEFENWLTTEVGDNGVGAAFASLAASPMHHIQKEFLDATDFYYHYRDNPKPMARLAEAVGVYYEKIFQAVLNGPQVPVLWGANFDDMITYPSYFAKEIQPWLKKVGPAFKAKGQVTICHCDGENLGLMDLLPDSGFQIAEAICPWPMTKVTLREYYGRWHGRLTIFGGLPSNLLLDELTTDYDFEQYLDNMFKDLAPGSGLIIGIADTTPPQANFDRLRRLGDRLRGEGRLPLTAKPIKAEKTAPPKPKAKAEEATSRAAAAGGQNYDETSNIYGPLCQMVLDGDDEKVTAETKRLLAQNHAPKDIMAQGLVLAMDIISPQFKSGQIFIPEVLLAARAMNLAMEILGPHMQSEVNTQKTIVLGTVFGDLHDIGKNMVATMLTGAGFKVIDLGINVPLENFLAALKKHKPPIVGLSALLTTTMPEMAKVVSAIRKTDFGAQVKIMVGGAPINHKFAQDIGADGYSADAGEAVELARKLAKII
ncbi:MAG: cobalamin B12-binding domain-containing protein, partial [Candidatus Adiutrix sp.]